MWIERVLISLVLVFSFSLISRPAIAQSVADEAKLIDAMANTGKARADIIRSYADTGRAYADIIRASAEYIRMLGEARLQTARAWLTAAQAVQQMEETRKLHLLVNRLDLELWLLRKEEYATRQKIIHVQRTFRGIAPLAVGRATSYTFLSLRGLLAAGTSPETIVEAFSVTAGPLGVENFEPNRPADIVAEFPGGNVGQLGVFAERHNYSFAPYGKAHLLFLMAVGKLGAKAQEKVKEYQTYMVGIRNGTLSPWVVPTPTPKVSF